MVSGQTDGMLMYDATVCGFLSLHRGLSQVPGTTPGCVKPGRELEVTSEGPGSVTHCH